MCGTRFKFTHPFSAMNGKATAIMAMALAVVMVLSIMPLPADAEEGAVPSVSMVENEDGVYEFRSEYFEDAFGLYPNPSDIEDPVDGMVDVLPSEIATPYGDRA